MICLGADVLSEAIPFAIQALSAPVPSMRHLGVKQLGRALLVGVPLSWRLRLLLHECLSTHGCPLAFQI